MSVKRRTEIYKVSITQRNPDKGRIDKQELHKYNVLSNFIKFYFCKYKYTNDNDAKVTKSTKNICYYIDDVNNEEDVYSVVLKYIKFNVSIPVVDIGTLEHKYTKEKHEGDQARQHYILKVYNNQNKGVLVYEKVTGAVTVGMVSEHINSSYNEWIKETYSDDEETRKYLLGYKVAIEIIPSPNFIEEIEKMEKISLLKITVLKENLTSDEDLLYSEDNVSRKDVEVLYKPIRTLSFSKKKIIKYFEMYEGNKEKIKRLVISGRDNGNNISLDTERMKLSEYIETNVDVDGLVSSEDIIKKYKELLNQRFKEYIDEIINKEIVLEVDNKEE